MAFGKKVHEFRTLALLPCTTLCNREDNASSSTCDIANIIMAYAYLSRSIKFEFQFCVSMQLKVQCTKIKIQTEWCCRIVVVQMIIEAANHKHAQKMYFLNVSVIIYYALHLHEYNLQYCQFNHATSSQLHRRETQVEHSQLSRGLCPRWTRRPDMLWNCTSTLALTHSWHFHHLLLCKTISPAWRQRSVLDLYKQGSTLKHNGLDKQVLACRWLHAEMND